MHHIYTRRIVIALVAFFTLLGVIFGPLVVSLRSNPAAASLGMSESVSTSGEGSTVAGAIALPDGATVFSDYCASCHKADRFTTRLTESLSPDSVSQGQLEFLVGPPPHGGVSPVEALAVVIHLRSSAGLESNFAQGLPTPAAAATAAAALPTPTRVPLDREVAPADYQAVWEQTCAGCHMAGRFAEGIAAAPNPKLAYDQALVYLQDPEPHKGLPIRAFRPAMSYVWGLTGLPALP